MNILNDSDYDHAVRTSEYLELVTFVWCFLGGYFPFILYLGETIPNPLGLFNEPLGIAAVILMILGFFSGWYLLYQYIVDLQRQMSQYRHNKVLIYEANDRRTKSLPLTMWTPIRQQVVKLSSPPPSTADGKPLNLLSSDEPRAN
jgi:hypothetical protein